MTQTKSGWGWRWSILLGGLIMTGIAAVSGDWVPCTRMGCEGINSHMVIVGSIPLFAGWLASATGMVLLMTYANKK